MRPSDAEIGRMAAALTRVSSGAERARRRGEAAGTLAVLQVVEARGRARPSEIAEELDVHLSTVSRRVRALEDAGHVELDVDPDDRRSCFVALTEAGEEELGRLTRFGVGRFARFVEGWEAGEVRELGRLLEKLEASISEVREREWRPEDGVGGRGAGGRRWQQRSQSHE